MTLPDLKTTRIAGRTLSWREKGTGTALLLIHGTGGSSASWEAQFAHFSGQYRVIAWDAPGYGGSDPWGANPTAAEYAGLLGQFLDSHGVATAHVVGHSIGAALAASLCRQKPTTVLSLTLVHPFAGLGGMDDAAREAARAARLAGVDASGMAGFVSEWAPTVLSPATGPEVLTKTVAIMEGIAETAYRDMTEVITSADIHADLPKVRAPALVIAGADDVVATPEACGAIAAGLAEAELATFDNIGHYLPLEDPALFRRTLDRFLADKMDVSTYF